MTWEIRWRRSALKELEKLDRQIQKRILRYVRETVAPLENPRQVGKSLTGHFAGCWRYRVGDFRLVCRIEDDRLVVLILRAAHRRDVYDR